MIKTIKLKDNHTVCVETDFEDIDDYFANVPTQDYMDEDYFYAEDCQQGSSGWYPIEGARFTEEG